MKILACHNHYQQPGGEDRSFSDEVALLRANGHEVIEYTRHNNDVGDMSRLRLAAATLYNRRTRREVAQIIRRERPDVMHCTNTFPLISPAVYDAAGDHGVPVVQALRNYRLVCPAGTFLRGRQVCESCVGKTLPWPAVRYGCYRQDRLASAVVAAMLLIHRLRGTWIERIDRFYTLTGFAREKFIQAGLPPDRIDLKSNFVALDPGPRGGDGGYAVYVGRLAPEKGIESLLSAWLRLDQVLPLKIVGDGPLRPRVVEAQRRDPRIEWLGRQPTGNLPEIVGRAMFLIMPSIWYETFGRTIIEAFAVGTPVIASRLGAMEELIQENQSGMFFQPGDAADLCRCIQEMAVHPELGGEFRLAARRAYLERFTAQPNHQQLIAIYQRAIHSRTTRVG